MLLAVVVGVGAANLRGTLLVRRMLIICKLVILVISAAIIVVVGSVLTL